MNPFEALNDSEQTDQRYVDRVNFFLALKKEASATPVAKDNIKDLLNSKAVVKAKLNKSTAGRMRSVNIDKNYTDSAKAVARQHGAQGSKIVQVADAPARVRSAVAAKADIGGNAARKRVLARRHRLKLNQGTRRARV